jgi:diguanylate cyclase (GGDEF)-like protein
MQSRGEDFLPPSRLLKEVAAVHRLTRALGHVEGIPELCAVVLQHLVRIVPTRVGSFAVPSGLKELSIVASHGYPAALVEHVRIPSGSGIIGTVYQKGTPLCVPDIAAMTDLPARRRRYRTNSFVALPVMAGSAILGVVCLADRVDGAPFTRRDVNRLRRLLAPAGLALALERTRHQAQSYAYAAVIDPVSGLFNRRYFQMRLHEELERADRQTTPVALLMIDVDDFKNVNDRFGHTAGDLVIRDVSRILRRSVRIFDVCTRFGGEEFAVVMPGAAERDAERVAERIRRRIEIYRPDEPALRGLQLTASVGLSVAQSDASRDLIERADRALYAAKHSGKNRVVLSATDEADVPNAADWTIKVRDA